METSGKSADGSYISMLRFVADAPRAQIMMMLSYPYPAMDGVVFRIREHSCASSVHD